MAPEIIHSLSTGEQNLSFVSETDLPNNSTFHQHHVIEFCQMNPSETEVWITNEFSTVNDLFTLYINGHSLRDCIPDKAVG